MQNFPGKHNHLSEKALEEKQGTGPPLRRLLTSKPMGVTAERAIDIRILKLKPENFAEPIALFYTDRVNSTNAQKSLGEMLEPGS